MPIRLQLQTTVLGFVFLLLAEAALAGEYTRLLLRSWEYCGFLMVLCYPVSFLELRDFPAP